MSRLQTKREGPEGPEARAWHTEARGLSTVTWGGAAETAEWSWGARTCGASHIPEELCRLLGSRWEGSQWKVLSRGTDVTCVPAGCWVEHRLKAARSRGPVTTRIQVRKDGGSGEVRGTLTTDTYRMRSPASSLFAEFLQPSARHTRGALWRLWHGHRSPWPSQALRAGDPPVCSRLGC